MRPIESQQKTCDWNALNHDVVLSSCVYVFDNIANFPNVKMLHKSDLIDEKKILYLNLFFMTNQRARKII